MSKFIRIKHFKIYIVVSVVLFAVPYFLFIFFTADLLINKTAQLITAYLIVLFVYGIFLLFSFYRGITICDDKIEKSISFTSVVYKKNEIGRIVIVKNELTNQIEKIYVTKKISSGFGPMIFDKIYDLELVYNELIKHGFVCEIQYF